MNTYHLEIQFVFVAYYPPLYNLGDLAPLPIHCDDPTVELPTCNKNAMSFIGLIVKKLYFCHI